MFRKFGDFIDLDPDTDTINPDPHHWFSRGIQGYSEGSLRVYKVIVKGL